MHLIVFCDGTWNTPDQMDGDLPAPTNVVKLRNALLRDESKQKVYYHPGVGTDRGLWNRVAGGGMGDGLDKNIKSSYNWLARNYDAKANPKIWLFGFSRGAYTARSLGGMISRCGLLNAHTGGLSEAEIWAAIDGLFDNYRIEAAKAPKIKATGKLPLHGVKTGDPGKHSIPIHFIGVWDTVGALGVPDDLALLNLIDDPANHSFHDTDLSPIVKNARHAVAIDEKRQGFTPTLWTNVEKDERVKQVWFPGVHGDVGGGYGRTALSDIALRWMMDEAKEKELLLAPDVENQLKPDPQGQLHDSVTGIFKSFKTRPRAVPLISEESIEKGLIHTSVWNRCDRPSIVQGDYWRTEVPLKGKPVTVTVYARDRWNSTGIYLNEGQAYRFSAEGEWKDDDITCDADGPLAKESRNNLFTRLALTATGFVEKVYTGITGNHNVDVNLSLREDEYPWFSLIGVVANGWLPAVKPEDKINHLPHETFLIGKQAKLTPKKSGYLYAFANDTWQTYENNMGALRLTVEAV
jgi:uncharacterized protein (DUF2235 family)